MANRRGIFISEDDTPIVPPVRVNASLPVVFVTAPIHLSEDPYNITNEPRLLFTNAAARREFGFSMRPGIWDNYTAPQVIFSQFNLFGVSPMILINVLDPDIHSVDETGAEVTLRRHSGVLQVDGVLIDTVQVESADGQTQYEEDTHYTLAFNRDGLVVINVRQGVGIAETQTLSVSYTRLAPEMVDEYDYIGGVDIQTDKNLGLEIIGDIFPVFRKVPGQILAPKWSGNPVVAAVMETKAANINGHFRCITLNDMPTMIDNASGEPVPHRFQNIPAWKNNNNYVSTRQVNLYPMLRLGNQKYHYSSQMAGLIGRTDFDNGDIPYESPSNNNLQINGLCYENGDEIVLNNEKGAYLNSQGIVTAINFTNGWVAWGNRTGAFPGTTDVKDAFIPIRRMFDWIGNTLVLTHFGRIDSPITPRLIETVIDSGNIWLNGLAARGFILGGRIEPLQEEDNPLTDVLDGMLRFRVRVSPPPPWEMGEFILQYDPDYLMTLFA